MTTQKHKTIADHALLTICAILAAFGYTYTPAELLRRLTGLDPGAALSPTGCSCKPKVSSGLLTTEQVAGILNCSKRSVERMANDGALTRRYLRPGNHKSLRFSEAEVAALCSGVPAADVRGA